MIENKRDPEKGNPSNLLCLIIIIFVSVIPYINTLTNDFTNWDDQKLIVNNSYIKGFGLKDILHLFTSKVGDAYLPMRDFSYAIDYAIWGLNPVGFHITNITLHVLNSIIIFLLLSLIIRHKQLSLISSVIFALHPIHVEAVAWLSGRKDVLSGFFSLLSIYMYVLFKNSGKGDASFGRQRIFFYIISLLMFFLAMLSKAVSVVVPLLLPFIDTIAAKDRKRSYLAYIPFLFLSCIFIYINIYVAKEAGAIKGYIMGDYHMTFLIMVKVFLKYIIKLFFPFNLCISYYIPPANALFDIDFICSIVVLLLYLVLAILSIRRWHAVSLWMWWYLIFLLPVSNIIPISTHMADRYLYLPSLAFCLMLGCAFVWTARQTRSIVILFPVLCFILCMRTLDQNRIWSDSGILFRDALSKNPVSTIFHSNLGNDLAKEGDKDSAVMEYLIALDMEPANVKAYEGLSLLYKNTGDIERALYCQKEALRIEDSAKIKIGLGEILINMGRYEEAEAMLQDILKKEPSNLDAIFQLSLLYINIGELDKAESLLDDGFKISGHMDKLYINRAYIYGKRGDFIKAVYTLTPLIKNDTREVKAYRILGDALTVLCKFDIAEGIYRKGLTIEPASADLWAGLGMLYVKSGDNEKALRLLKTALKYKKDTEIYCNMGTALISLKRYKEAEGQFLAALKIDDTFLPALKNLICVYRRLGEVDKASQISKRIEEISGIH